MRFSGCPQIKLQRVTHTQSLKGSSSKKAKQCEAVSTWRRLIRVPEQTGWEDKNWYARTQNWIEPILDTNNAKLRWENFRVHKIETAHSLEWTKFEWTSRNSLINLCFWYEIISQLTSRLALDHDFDENREGELAHVHGLSIQDLQQSANRPRTFLHSPFILPCERCFPSIGTCSEWSIYSIWGRTFSGLKTKIRDSLERFLV